MKKTYLYTTLFFFIIGITAIASFFTFAPSSVPAPTSYTLNDLYHFIQSNTVPTVTNHLLSTTTSTVSTTSHSIGEIYILLANLVDPANLPSGISKLGATSGSAKPATLTTTHIGFLTPTANTVVATGYSLEDIWNLIQGTRVTSSSHTLSTSNIPSGTMHSITAIYSALAGLFSSSDINSGTTYLGVSGSYTSNFEIGELCTLHGECASGYCGSNEYEQQVCTSGGIGEYCYDNEGCVEGLLCDLDNTWKCIGLPLGEMCEMNIQCAPNECDTYYTSTCVLAGELGSSCSIGGDCDSMYCDTGLWGVCTSGLVGDSCGNNTDCSTGYCGYDVTGNRSCTNGVTGVDLCALGNECASGFCDTFSTYMCSEGATGDYCSDDTECNDGYGLTCSNNQCDLLTGNPLGEVCITGDDCLSGYCGSSEYETQICTNGETAIDHCYDNAGCVSGVCNIISWLCN